MSLRQSSILLRPLDRDALRYLARQALELTARERRAPGANDPRANEARQALEARGAAIAAHAEPALC